MNSIGIVKSMISSFLTDRKSKRVGVHGVDIRDDGLNIPTTGCAGFMSHNKRLKMSRTDRTLLPSLRRIILRNRYQTIAY
jgi:hypothetical protein